jgi:hypothetical protein
MAGLATLLTTFSAFIVIVFLTGIAGEIGYTYGLLWSSFVGSLPSCRWAGLRLSTECQKNEV